MMRPFLTAASRPSLAFCMPLQTMQFAKVSRNRAKEVLAFEIKKLGSIEIYFEKLMRRRHVNE